jgi:hypothetical protein
MLRKTLQHGQNTEKKFSILLESLLLLCGRGALGGETGGKTGSEGLEGLEDERHEVEFADDLVALVAGCALEPAAEQQWRQLREVRGRILSGQLAGLREDKSTFAHAHVSVQLYLTTTHSGKVCVCGSTHGT